MFSVWTSPAWVIPTFVSVTVAMGSGTPIGYIWSMSLILDLGYGPRVGMLSNSMGPYSYRKL